MLKDTVLFGSMVDPYEKLPVKIVMLLAIKDPSVQLIFLKNMIRVFMKKDVIPQMLSANDENGVKEVWKSIVDTEEFKEFNV